jgi:hypothetical protein
MTFQVRFDIRPSAPREYGWFAVNVSGRAAGRAGIAGVPFELTGSSNPLKDPRDRAAVEAKLKLKIEEDWTLGLKSKLDRKSLDEIIAAFREGGRSPAQRVAAAFARTLGVEGAHAGAIGPVDTEVGGGIEAKHLLETPVSFYSKGTWAGTTEAARRPIRYEVQVEGRVHLGLSKRGWAEVVRRVGSDAVRQGLQRGGVYLARLGAWLVSSGVLTAAVSLAGGVAGTFGLVALTAHVTGRARREGEIKGLETWYVSGYASKVFGRDRPEQRWWPVTVIPDAAEIAARLVVAGERDAVEDARRTARTPFGDPDHASAPEDAILRRHRARLERLHGGSTAAARHALEQSLKTRAQERLGLR